MRLKKYKKFKFCSHAIQRMFEHGISKNEVIKTMNQGEIIASYPEDKPYPSYLSMIIIDQRPIHVVFADNSEDREAIIITVYIPDRKHWTNDYKSRRK